MKLSAGHILALVLPALVCALIVTLTHQLTRERIAENVAKRKLRVIDAVLNVAYDNPVHHDFKAVDGEMITAYRARRGGQPVGVVFMPVAARGYNEGLRIAVGIHYDGRLAGVQVLQHRETQGLGSLAHQDQSDWLRVFTGRSLADPPPPAWATRNEGGDFDQLSGATVTSRGVINAVRNSLQLYLDERETLFSD